MTLFRSISLLFLVATLAAGFAVEAKADPTISLTGEGWKAQKTFGGVRFICETAACGGDAVVELGKIKTLSDSEEQLNKPYANVRALINGALYYGFDGQDGGMKFSEIKKTATKDYTAVHLYGNIRGVSAAIMLIYQGSNLYILTSGAESEKLARANLVKAFKSGDFRRPG
ncbi:hypothetical protein [Kaistia algarum]|uniref:hypothetical protein n=1 Tax=Kaistia algarum TaxID=2083279 RepID=UPI001057222B|nr:hypothetical protein [Kaistia algarum]MCX5516073.1 hypothetical protein [Kaistia algarum]